MNPLSHLNIVCLAGGVGGAKLADGLAQIVAPENLTIIVNTGDDFNHLGLTICPDLDTVVYTLGRVANTETGWGPQDESWQVLAEISQLNRPDWFRLAGKAFMHQKVRQVHQFANSAPPAKPPFMDGCNPGTVIAAIFQPFQRFHQQGRNFVLA